MSFFDRFRAPDVRERKARERAERAAADARQAEAARQAEVAAEMERQREFYLDAIGPELAEAPADTPADAKLAIKLARLRKKELQAEKRDIAAQLADHREEWRERQAGRIYTGALGRRSLIRYAVQANRRSERLEHTDIVNAFSDAKQGIDGKIAVVDRLIVELERVAAGSVGGDT